MPKVRKEARITSKGQITVPLPIRQMLGVRPGDRLVFEAEANEVSVRPLRTVSSFEKYRGALAGLPRTRRQMLQYIRELRGR